MCVSITKSFGDDSRSRFALQFRVAALAGAVAIHGSFIDLSLDFYHCNETVRRNKRSRDVAGRETTSETYICEDVHICKSNLGIVTETLVDKRVLNN